MMAIEWRPLHGGIDVSRGFTFFDGDGDTTKALLSVGREFYEGWMAEIMVFMSKPFSRAVLCSPSYECVRDSVQSIAYHCATWP